MQPQGVGAVAPQVEAVDDDPGGWAGAADRDRCHDHVGHVAVLSQGFRRADQGNDVIRGPQDAAEAVTGEAAVVVGAVRRPQRQRVRVVDVLAIATRPGLAGETRSAARRDREAAIAAAHGKQLGIAVDQDVGRPGAEQNDHADTEAERAQVAPTVTPQAEPQAADDHHGEAAGGRRRQGNDGARPTGDHLGDGDDDVDPPPDGCQCQRFQSQRHQAEGDHGPRHHPQCRYRYREQVGGEAVLGEPVEVMDGKRRRRQPGDQGRQGDAGEIEQDAGRQGGRIGPPRIGQANGFVGRDQRGDRGEGQLEARREQALRRREQDQHGCPCHRPHGEAAPVDEHREENHGDHQECALARHIAAGEDGVGAGAGDADHGRPLLRRHPHREWPDQGQRGPDAEKQYARHQPDVQPGDGEQMGKPGIADGGHHVGRDGAAIAGHQRRRDAAGFAGELGADAAVDGLAQPVDGAHPGGVAHIGVDDCGGTEDVADRPQAVEEGTALEIERPGRRGRRRRHQHGADDDALPRHQRRLLATQSDAHPHRGPLRAQPVDTKLGQRRAEAVRAVFDQVDAAVHRDRPEPAVQHRRRDQGRPDLRRGEAQRQRTHGQRHDDGQGAAAVPAAATERAENCGRGDGRGAEPARRLHGQREIEGDAGTQADRQPQGPAVAIGDQPLVQAKHRTHGGGKPRGQRRRARQCSGQGHITLAANTPYGLH